jgi:hypothetical protein
MSKFSGKLVPLWGHRLAAAEGPGDRSGPASFFERRNLVDSQKSYTYSHRCAAFVLLIWGFRWWPIFLNFVGNASQVAGAHWLFAPPLGSS